MNNDLRHGQSDNGAVVTSVAIMLVHLFWSFVGPIVFALLLSSIVRAGGRWLTAVDSAALLVAALILVARWIDQRSGQATTTSGDPATREDFRRYVLVFPPVAGAAWIAAHLAGSYMLS
jgi:hypothetical protein